MNRGIQASWKQGNLLPVHLSTLAGCIYYAKNMEGGNLVAIKFKDNAADIVKTVDRAGLMTNRFKDLSLRTKDDLEDMFGQREGLFTICNKAKDCKEREDREMSDLSELTSELMQDKEFRKEYEDLQPEMNIMRAMMDARIVELRKLPVLQICPILSFY